MVERGLPELNPIGSICQGNFNLIKFAEYYVSLPFFDDFEPLFDLVLDHAVQFG